MATHTVVFGCHDRSIVDYLVATFGDSFQKRIDETPRRDLPALERELHDVVMKEAEKQEWYDYLTCNVGERHLIKEADGKPKLIRISVEILPCP